MRTIKLLRSFSDASIPPTLYVFSWLIYFTTFADLLDAMDMSPWHNGGFKWKLLLLHVVAWLLTRTCGVRSRLVVLCQDYAEIAECLKCEAFEHVIITLPSPQQRFEIIRNCVEMTENSLAASRMIRIAFVDASLSYNVPATNLPPSPIETLHVGQNCAKYNPSLQLHQIAAKITANSHGFVAADLSRLWSDIFQSSFAEFEMRRATASSDCVEESINITGSLIDFHLKNAQKTAIHLKNARATTFQCSNVTWADIGGLEEVKSMLISSIAPSTAPSTECKQNFLGILLHGPPGTGKTLLAKALSNQCEANFFPISIPDLVKAEIGESEKSLHYIFALASQCQPSIVFIDEMDAMFGGQRAAETLSGGADVVQRLLSQLLLEIDTLRDLANHRGDEEYEEALLVERLAELSAFDSESCPPLAIHPKSNRVIVLGATNLPHLIDASLLRPGRLGKSIYIPPPDLKSRKSIFKTIHLKFMQMDASNECAEGILDPLFIFEMASNADGFSGADIANVGRMAGMTAIQRWVAEHPNVIPKHCIVTQADLRSALESVGPSISAT